MITKFVTLVGLMACFGTSVGFADKVKVCIGDFPPYELGSEFLAQNAKDFEVTRANLVTCLRRFSAGYFDLMQLDTPGFAKSQLPKMSKIVGLVDYSDGADSVIVQTAKINEPIKGSTFAAVLESASVFVLYQYLQSKGLSYSDIKVVDLKVENSKNFMTNGRFHGIATWEPYTSQAVAAGGKVVFTSKETKIKVFDTALMADKIDEAKKPLVKKYLDARYKDASDFGPFMKHYASLSKRTVADATPDFDGLYLFKTHGDAVSKKADVIASLNAAQDAAELLAKSTKSKFEKQTFNESNFDAKMFAGK